MLMTPEETNHAAEELNNLKFTRSNPFMTDIINQRIQVRGKCRVGEKEYGFDLNQVMALTQIMT